MLPYRVVYLGQAVGNIPHLIGLAGEGKSEAVVGMANWASASQVYTMYLAQNDPITLGTGIPMKNEETGTFSLATWDKVINIFTDPNAWLFADELADGDMDQQRAFSPIVLTRQIAGIPIECSIICASNPPEEGANELDKRLANRLMHVPWEMGTQDFVDGLTKGWDTVMGKAPVLPGDWTQKIGEKEELIAKFLTQFPQRFKARDAMTSNFPAFPTARSWQKFAARWLAGADAAGLSKKDTQLGLEGCIGKGVAGDFILWNRHDGIDVMGIVQDPTKLKEYKEGNPSTQNAIFEAVNAYTAEKTISGTDCGAFYAAALKYGFDPDFILRHARKVTDKLPRQVRESILAEISVRLGADKQA